MANAFNENSEDGLLPILFEQDEPDEFGSSEKSHTVTFRCIGANRDSSHQIALHVPAEHIRAGQSIPVRLNPEPDNTTLLILMPLPFNVLFKKSGKE